MPILLSRPTELDVEHLLARVAAENLTYTGPPVADGDPHLPGYRYGGHVQELGDCAGVFERAKEALRRWDAHHQLGAAVAPVDAPLALGADVVVTLKLGPAYMLAPCRIVSVADGADRFGFSYATLPGHPERGEEAFHVERAPDGRVSFRVQVVSRPALALARLGGPFTRVVQSQAMRKYARGIRLAVSPVP